MNRHAKKMRERTSNAAIMLICIVVLSMAFTGCTNIKHAPLEIHYYTLEYDPPQSNTTPSLAHVVKIEQFQTSPLYDSNRMIFKDEDFKRDEYTYHKWRALPGELVAYFLARDFLETNRFQATLYYESTLPSTHTITGVVEEFYLDGRNSGEAVLSVAVNLIENTRNNDGSPILMQKKYRLGIETSQSGPQGLAMAMSTAMQQISAEILMDVATLLQE